MYKQRGEPMKPGKVEMCMCVDTYLQTIREQCYRWIDDEPDEVLDSHVIEVIHTAVHEIANQLMEQQNEKEKKKRTKATSKTKKPRLKRTHVGGNGRGQPLLSAPQGDDKRL